MESLWPIFDEVELERNQTIEILRQQARAISKDTNNKIKATFSKMEYKKGAITAVEQLDAVVKAVSPANFEEVLDEELIGKQNVNDLFTAEKYKFEIYNEEYRFRLFTVKYCELFPIALIVDDGISKEISYRNDQPINSNEDLKKIVRDIFSCKKVRTVIAKMKKD